MGNEAEQHKAVEKAIAGLPATSTISESASIMSMLERMSQNPACNVDTMKAMLEMWERIRDKNAEVAFNRDFAKMSLDMPRIEKNGTVSYAKEKGNPKAGMEEAFKFALYEDIDFHIRPILERHGFSLSFTTSERQGGGLVVNGILAHREGHSRITSLPLALDTSGGKNNLQAMGSSSSYGRRYAACILLNIITIDEDTDGNIKKDGIESIGGPILDAQAKSDIEADFPKSVSVFKTKEDRVSFIADIRDKLRNADSEDTVNSLLEEHGGKFKYLSHAQQKHVNAMFIEAKDQFGTITQAG